MVSWRALVRALLVTCGRGVVLRGLVLGTLLLFVWGVFFGPSGVRAVDLVRPFHARLAVRLLMASGWTLVCLPVMAGAFAAPGSRFVRSIVGLDRRCVVVALGLALAVELPCGLFFLCAEGPISAASVMALSAALLVSATDLRPLRSRAIALAAALLLAADPPARFGLLPALALAYLATGSAWRSALEQRRASWRWTRPGHPLLVVTLAAFAVLARGARARLSIAALAIGGGGLGVAWSLLNDPTTRPVHRGMCIFSYPLSVALAVTAAPLLAFEKQVRAVATPAPPARVRRPLLLAAFALAFVTPSSALAATASALAGAAAHAPVVGLGLAVGAWTAPIAALVGGWSWWYERQRRRRPALFVVGVVVVAVLAGAAAR